MSGDRILSRSFFERDALAVARDLIGRRLARGDVVLRITETEAYRFPNDSANHCRVGRTPRNLAMWGPPGHAYVYLCYGLHTLLNLVTDRDGEAAAVLIRGAEPLRGLATIQARRGLATTDPRALLAGPGKVGQALGLDTSFSGRVLSKPGDLVALEGDPVDDVLVGPRIGIDYARPADRAAPYRFGDPRSSAVAQRRAMWPLRRFVGGTLR